MEILSTPLVIDDESMSDVLSAPSLSEATPESTGVIAAGVVVSAGVSCGEEGESV